MALTQNVRPSAFGSLLPFDEQFNKLADHAVSASQAPATSTTTARPIGTGCEVQAQQDEALRLTTSILGSDANAIAYVLGQASLCTLHLRCDASYLRLILINKIVLIESMWGVCGVQETKCSGHLSDAGPGQLLGLLQKLLEHGNQGGCIAVSSDCWTWHAYAEKNHGLVSSDVSNNNSFVWPKSVVERVHTWSTCMLSTVTGCCSPLHARMVIVPVLAYRACKRMSFSGRATLQSAGFKSLARTYNLQ